MAYQPATNLTTTGTLAHLATVYYSRRALDQLRKRFHFLEATQPDEVPQRVGKLIQWYRYSLLAANTTAATEGTVETGLALTTTTVQATVVEYTDFISVSSLLRETAIDPIVENAARELSYRAALSVDTITRTEFDAASGQEIATIGAAPGAGDLRRSRALLEGIDVLPIMGEDFVGIIHPYTAYDLMADNTAGGFIDVMKYAQPGALLNGEVGKIGGVRLMATTNVKTSGTAPDTEYWMYVVGNGAVGSVDLAGVGPQRVSDPNQQTFNINVIRGGPSPADPAGVIGGWVSYRYVYVAKNLDTTNDRFYLVKTNPTLI